MALRHVGEAIETRGEIGVLARLHQPEMALGQRERLVARHRADHRDAQRGDGVGHQRAMPLAADAVEHDPGDADRGIVSEQSRAPRPPPIAPVRRRRARAAPADESARQGRRSRPMRPGSPGDAVEQAHDAFDHQQVGAARGLGGERVEQRRRHGPAVEIEARRAGGGGVEGRVDIVRSGFCRPHRQAAPRQRGQQRKRDGGLAGAGAGAAMMRPRARHRGTLSAVARSEQPLAHRHDVADDHDRRRLEGMLARVGGHALQRRDEDALIRRSSPTAITAAGVCGCEPSAHQRVGDPLEIVHHHVEHDRLRRCAQAAPSRMRRPRHAWPAAKMTARLTPRSVAGIDAAASAASPAVTPGMMRNGTPAAASAKASSPPRPNTNGSPPLSRSTRWPARASSTRRLRDVGLRRRRLAAALAGEFEPRLRSGERQHALVDQRVVHDDVGLREAGERIERQQAGIARSGAGQPDMPRLEHRNAVAQCRQCVPASFIARASPS